MLTVTLTAQAIGMLCLIAVVPFYGGHPSRAELLWSAGGGVFGGIGIALLYHALSIGKMGVVSPITAVLAAAFPVAVGIARGEGLRWFQLAGILVALVAVVLISLSKEESGEREIGTAGVKEAIASGLALGAFFIVLGLGQHGHGFDGLLAARVGTVAFLLAVALVTRTALAPQRASFGLVAACGCVDVAANVLFVIAAQTGRLAVAAVLTSLYPASTVLLASTVLRERLQTVQKVGVGLALIGVALIAA